MKSERLFSKLAALVLTVCVMLSVVSLCAAAEDGTVLFDFDNSWFFAQNENPHSGSYCTASYFNGSEFQKLDTYVSGSGWKTANGKAYIETWRVHLTKGYSPAIEFNPYCGQEEAKAGYLEITDASPNSMRTDGTAAELMIVQRSGDGAYCPIYPTVGVWEWKKLTDTATDIGTVKTYCSSTDKVYVVYRTDSETTGCVETMPKFKYVESANDTQALRASYSFTEWKDGETEDKPEVFDSPIGWYVSQSIQPWEGSYYTFEYFNTNTGTFQKLEKFHSEADPAFWSDMTDTVSIKGWETTSGRFLYAALAFHPDADGKVVLTSGKSITGEAENGQFMLLLRSSDQYSPLTGWIDIPKGGSVNLPDITTYVKAGDKVYYVFRSKTEVVSVAKFDNPGVVYTKNVADTQGLYPSVWKSLDEIFAEQGESGEVNTGLPKTDDSGKKSPQTGDDRRLAPMTMLFITALFAAIASLLKRGGAGLRF